MKTAAIQILENLEAMDQYLQMAVVKQLVNPAIRVRTGQLEQLGLKAIAVQITTNGGASVQFINEPH